MKINHIYNPIKSQNIAKPQPLTANSERYEIPRENAAKSLWKAYRRTPEYKSGRIYSINSVHPLVRQAEERGLSDIILDFISQLEKSDNTRQRLISRNESDWIQDWRKMHTLLLRRVYRQTGNLRPQGHDVRFGSPGDEDLHRIPHGGAEVYNELFTLARSIKDRLAYIDIHQVDEVCRFLAQFHYGFIRIHPFFDGNGRIARVVTDQLSVSLGYIPIIAGFPRSNTQKKAAYHAAITGCANDYACSTLTDWIKHQLTEKLAEII